MMTDDLPNRVDHNAGTSGKLADPQDETKISPRIPSSMPKKVGRYAIKSLIDSGGMAQVYLAVQEHPRRKVALKLMRTGITSRSALRRFEFESQILGRLRHPAICQIYEAGVHYEESVQTGGEGIPYFAMEYIPNAKPITEYAREKKLSTKQRLELFAMVCDAVHHGHQKGIIHRDLKPSNILVDSAGRPRIIDFGVARSTDSDMAVTTLQTDVGQLIGTLQYMSPEQCLADPDDLDTRSDVYALGVMLYELLCDQLPYDVTKVAVFEAARIVKEEAPARPSTINRTLRGDVETIALKALEKDRERRYKSAEALGDDINKYLSNEPIEARPPSVTYQIRMFARRNRTLFAALMSIAAVLVMATIVSVWFLLQANKARDNLTLEVEQRELEVDQRKIAEENVRDEATAARAAEDEADRLQKEAETQTYYASIFAAGAALKDNDFGAARRFLDRAPVNHRNWEWDHLSAKSDLSLTVLRGHGGWVEAASFSPDGTRIVTASLDRTARVWDAATGEELAVLRGHEDGVFAALFSPDGTSIVTASMDKTARLWDAATGEKVAVLRGHEDWVTAASFSPDGARIVTTSADKTARVWDTDTGSELVVLRGEDWLTAASFSPDGTRIVTTAWDSAARV